MVYDCRFLLRDRLGEIWLAQPQCTVATGHRLPDGPVYHVFEVL
jgi:hypothetical protein